MLFEKCMLCILERQTRSFLAFKGKTTLCSALLLLGLPGHATASVVCRQCELTRCFLPYSPVCLFLRQNNAFVQGDATYKRISWTMLQLPQLFALRSEHGRVLEASCSFCLSSCLLLFLPSMMKVLADLLLPPQLPPPQLPLASLLSSSQESAVPWLHTLQAHPVWLDPTSPTLTSSSRSLSSSDGSYHTLLRPSS